MGVPGKRTVQQNPGDVVEGEKTWRHKKTAFI